MTPDTDAVDDTDRAYWRAYIAKMDAERAKAARDAKKFPFMPLFVTGVYVTLLLWSGAWLGTYLPRAHAPTAPDCLCRGSSQPRRPSDWDVPASPRQSIEVRAKSGGAQ